MKTQAVHPADAKGADQLVQLSVRRHDGEGGHFSYNYRP